MKRQLALTSLALLAACTPTVRPPAPAPVPKPTPTPAPAPVRSPYVGDWRDWPVTPGNWVYRPAGSRGSSAQFGVAGQPAQFAIQCDPSAHRIILSRAAATGTMMTVRTSAMARTLTTTASSDAAAVQFAVVASDDPLLDAMAFSRGRFIIELSPLSPLVVPAWSEVSRVIEDCRR